MSDPNTTDIIEAKPVQLRSLGTTHCRFDEAGRLIIPKDFTQEVAGEMFNELYAVEEKAKSAKHELIAACVDRFGRKVALEIASQHTNTSPGYVDRVASIANNTVGIRQKHPSLKLNQLAALATLASEPKRQAEIAELAVENNLPAVMIMAMINRTDEVTERMNAEMLALQNSLKILATNADATYKAVNVCKQFVRNHDGKHKPN